MWHSFGLLRDSHIKTGLALDDQAKGATSGPKCGLMQSLQTRQANRQTDMAAKAESLCVVLLVAYVRQVARFDLFAHTSLHTPPLPISVQTSDPASALGGQVTMYRVAATRKHTKKLCVAQS